MRSVADTIDALRAARDQLSGAIAALEELEQARLVGGTECHAVELPVPPPLEPPPAAGLVSAVWVWALHVRWMARGMAAETGVAALARTVAFGLPGTGAATDRPTPPPPLHLRLDVAGRRVPNDEVEWYGRLALEGAVVWLGAVARADRAVAYRDAEAEALARWGLAFARAIDVPPDARRPP